MPLIPKAESILPSSLYFFIPRVGEGIPKFAVSPEATRSLLLLNKKEFPQSVYVEMAPDAPYVLSKTNV